MDIDFEEAIPMEIPNVMLPTEVLYLIYLYCDRFTRANFLICKKSFYSYFLTFLIPIKTIDEEYDTLSNGNKQGKYRRYFRFTNTLMFDIEFNNGERHGKYKRYFPTGILYEEIDYLYGKRHGVYKRWYRSGSLQYEKIYFNDNKILEIK